MNTDKTQVAVFVTEEGDHLLSEFAMLHDDLALNVLDALEHIEIPFDRFALRDLPHIELTPYRAVVFPNAFQVSEIQRNAIKTRVCCEDRTVLWLYAAGYVTGACFSLAGMEALTDFHLHEKPVDCATVTLLNSGMFGKINSELEFGFSQNDTGREISPTFYFDDRGAIPCAFYTDDSLPAMGYKRLPDYTSWYCAVGNIPAAVLREIVGNATSR